MSFEVYTSMPTPFRLGGSKGYIKTTIEEYERIYIGAGYFGILFYNKTANLWHMALEACGALIGSKKSKTSVIKMVKGDVAGGNPELFEQQIKMGKRQMSQAKFMERDEWFSHFAKAK